MKLLFSEKKYLPADSPHFKTKIYVYSPANVSSWETQDGISNVIMSMKTSY